MLHFATYFDINYLNRGVVLFESLIKQCSSPFKLFILALDNEVADYYAINPDEKIIVIPLKEIEHYFPELNQAKNNRSLVEYYFTLSPFLPIYILDVFPDVEQITTLDADIYFFSDPSVIFNCYKQASIIITPHSFPEKLKTLDKYGLYNVSFQSFKNNEDAKACLNDWKTQCLEWCHDYHDEKNGWFADQKYLDAWKEKYNNVNVIEMPGAGLAPWNIENYTLTVNNKSILVNNTPLIFYHYHGLRLINNYFALPNLLRYKAAFTKIIKSIYHIYLKRLKAASEKRNIGDSKVTRHHNVQRKTVLKILFEADEFLFFKSYFILNLKLNFLYLKYQRLSNKMHGRINKLSNVYR